jgi:hypothetical protein
MPITIFFFVLEYPWMTLSGESGCVWFRHNRFVTLKKYWDIGWLIADLCHLRWVWMRSSMTFVVLFIRHDADNHWILLCCVKKSRKSPDYSAIVSPELVLPFSIDFRIFAAGNGDFSLGLRPLPGVSGGRNHFPGVSRMKQTYAKRRYSVLFMLCFLHSLVFLLDW